MVLGDEVVFTWHLAHGATLTTNDSAAVITDRTLKIGKNIKSNRKLIARHKYWDLCLSLVVCCNCMAFKIDDDLRFASNWLIDWLLLVLHRIGSIVNWCTETSQLPVKGCTIWFYVHHFRSEDLKLIWNYLFYATSVFVVSFRDCSYRLSFNAATPWTVLFR